MNSLLIIKVINYKKSKEIEKENQRQRRKAQLRQMASMSTKA